MLAKTKHWMIATKIYSKCLGTDFRSYLRSLRLKPALKLLCVSVHFLVVVIDVLARIGPVSNKYQVDVEHADPNLIDRVQRHYECNYS